MIVERIWTGNALRNFNYLIACPETGEALAIDPVDHEKTLAAAKAKAGKSRRFSIPTNIMIISAATTPSSRRPGRKLSHITKPADASRGWIAACKRAM